MTLLFTPSPQDKVTATDLETGRALSPEEIEAAGLAKPLRDVVDAFGKDITRAAETYKATTDSHDLPDNVIPLFGRTDRE